MAFWGLPTLLIKVAIGVLLLRFIIIYSHRWFLNALSHEPGPFIAKFTDWYGAYHSALGQLHIRTLEAHKRYGSAFRGGPNKMVFNTVTAFHAPGVFNIHTAIDKELHRFKRRMISQGLSDPCMREFEPSLLEHVDKFVRNIARAASAQPGQWSAPVNMSEQCKYLGFDIMGEFGFGQSFGLLDGPTNRFLIDAVTAASHRSAVYGQFPDLAKVKLEKILYPRASSMRMKYMTLMTRLLRERLEAEEDGRAKRDLFSFIVHATDEETGRSFSQAELWSEARFLLIAGSDTTSTGLTALFFYLSRYPECYDKVAREVRSTFRSGHEIHCGLNSKMPQCVYLRACIDEAMRMTPPAGGVLWREVSKGSGGIVIDGHYVPEGCDVGASIYCVQHNEEYFPDSFSFCPDRWIVSEGNPKEKIELARQAFVPFSLGPRGCPGKTMAYMELSTAMAKALWYFDFEAADGDLGVVGAGKLGGPPGRQRPNEFQLIDHLTSTHDGPYIKYKLREDVSELLR
ncbi:cytochrome P450 [Paraphaeosphaeria sporulosa]|uniref:Cytochrome P450 n=1 Tax=Paraphaeosphaeria sporulosa TaxID=1460663 RepID=A0A177CHB2_9PLEO|nr:cytochrome P450 [Paraphaeosphaeria sporulosa]OAG06097.1 cytochrome P450 [Paraphaeosphaeria sporulosa]